MRPTWTERYLTIPFLEKGRTRAGVDCYGLVRLIYEEQRQVYLPSYTEGYETVQDTKEILALLDGAVASVWKEITIAEAKEFDSIVFRIMGQPTHFGVVMHPPWFIHAIKDSTATGGKVHIDRWDSLIWKHRAVGALRCQI